ncbi:MAG: cysteine hydrolase [Candidatus Eisenbacteria bacterium]|nr:cysteine hydrolase [Candidatus Eisenbacteria bacterium]
MEPYVTERNIQEKAGDWLKAIRDFNRHRLRLDKGRCALLVIDMQKYFLTPGSVSFIAGGPAVVPGLKTLVAAFRKAGRPVLYTRHVHHPDGIDAGIMKWWWDGMCVEGTPESEIIPALKPLKREKVVLKHRYSAFLGTDLDTILRCLKVRDLVVTGVLTNMCCETTTRDAYSRDYRTFFLADGTATINEEMHLASLLNLAYGFSYVTTVKEMVKALK